MTTPKSRRTWSRQLVTARVIDLDDDPQAVPKGCQGSQKDSGKDAATARKSRQGPPKQAGASASSKHPPARSKKLLPAPTSKSKARPRSMRQGSQPSQPKEEQPRSSSRSRASAPPPKLGGEQAKKRLLQQQGPGSKRPGRARSRDERPGKRRQLDRAIAEAKPQSKGGPQHGKRVREDAVTSTARPRVLRHCRPGSRKQDTAKEFKMQQEQLVNQQKTEFVCAICLHLVGRGPSLTSCQHLFCGDCIAQWVGQKRGGAPCPTCNTIIHKHDLVSLNGGKCEFIHRLLCNVQVVCENNSSVRGPAGLCNWTGLYSEYQKHRASCCNLPLDADSAGSAHLEAAAASNAVVGVGAPVPAVPGPHSAPGVVQQQPAQQLHVRFSQGGEWCSREMVLQAPYGAQVTLRQPAQAAGSPRSKRHKRSRPAPSPKKKAATRKIGPVACRSIRCRSKCPDLPQLPTALEASLKEFPFPDDGRSLLAALTFADLSVLGASSRSSNLACYNEIWRRCQDFTYAAGDFDSRRATRLRSGRVLSSPAKSVADRLMRFLDRS